MSYSSNMKRYFENDFYKQNDMNDIISYIESLEDTFIIKVSDISSSDIILKKKYPEEFIDLKIKKIENGISIPYMFDGFFDLIKDHICKSVKTISIPQDNIKDLDFKKLKNITTFNCNKYLEPEVLDYISKNTNIKTVNSCLFTSDYNKSNLKNIAFSNFKIVYNGVQVLTKEYPVYDINVIVKELDLDLIKKLLSNFDKKRNIIIYSDDLEIVNHYTELGMYGCCNIFISFNKAKKAKLSINCNDLNQVERIYNIFSSIYDINEIVVYVGKYNKKINYTSYDFKNLDKLSEKVPININYDYKDSSTYEEFRNYVDSINWYRRIISTYNLSPLEKLTFAYDIMKTFEYNESEKNSDDSRCPHRVINTGNIVCVGYTELLNEILYKFDDNIKTTEFVVRCFEEDDYRLRTLHSRSLVTIDDDKYNIHGSYVIDPTWDSDREDGKELYGNDYNALSLYRFFLITLKEYDKVFKHNSKPDWLFDKTIEGRKLTFEEFLTLIKNVRYAEGYYGNILEEEIDKVKRINAKYYGVEVGYELKKQSIQI